MTARAPIVDGRLEADVPELERIVVVGATFRELPTDAREAMAADLERLGAGWSERLLLHTCHRVELVGVADRRPEPPLGATVRHGVDAIDRLLAVVAGLDSAVVAEGELLGQVRDAYRGALDRGETGPVLNELVRRAIRHGRRVRSMAAPSTDPSLADRGARWALARLERPTEASVLVAGTGEMGRRMATAFAAAGLRVDVGSTSAERAAAIVARLPGDAHRAVAMPAVMRDAGDYDVVAIAVRGSATALGPGDLGPDHPRLVVDLSAPGAVSAEAATRLGDRLCDLDRLGRLEGGSPRALDASVERRLHADLVAERDGFVAWLRGRRGRGAVTLLRDGSRAIADRHLDRLRRRGALDDDQLAAVSAAVHGMLGELLHVPTERLRHGGADAATVRDLFGFDE